MSKRAFSIVLVAVVAVTLSLPAAHAGIQAGLAGYWPLDGDATDASRNGNNGTIVGSVSPVPDRYGMAGAALRFAGETDSYVDVGDSAELRITGPMTVTAWVLLHGSNQNNGRIVTKQGDVDNGSWNLGVEASPDGGAHAATFQVAAAPSDVVRVDDTLPLPTDRWVHLTGIYRPGETLEIYVDGMLRAETMADIPSTQFSDNGLSVLIGSGHGCSDCAWDGLIDEVRIYDRAISQVEIWQIMRANVGCSLAPQPADGATDVPPDVTLSWKAGLFAKTHDLYFGTVADDVNSASRTNPRNVLLSKGRSATTYGLNSDLDLGQTYYWRVDEVNAFDSFIYKGNLWRFTVESHAIPIGKVLATTNALSNDGAGPANTVNGSGLNDDDEHSISPGDMWLAAANGNDPVWLQYRFDTPCKLQEMLVWNYNDPSESGLGCGLKDVTVEYSTDGVAWTAWKDVELAQATGAPDYVANTTVALGGVVARYVRLTVHTTWGATGQYGLSEVRFLQIPTRARAPRPADGASGVDVDLVLNWSAGREAAFHDVHFNQSAPMVATGAAFLGSVTVNEYPAGSLNFGTPYYWRIDERNDAKSPSLWQGDIWTFITREYAVVDDFESYTDESGRRIYEIWRDGWENGTGSLVGHMEPPYAEKVIVHSGGQSMPFAYNNSESPFYSEAARTMAIAQKWQDHGADVLRLFVRGHPDNDPGSLYIAVEDTGGRVAVATHPNPAALTSAAWQEWAIPYSAFADVGLSAVQTVYLGVGDRDNPVPGGSGLIYIDDIERGRPIGGLTPGRR